jgi:tRNA (guanine-N7-)-methyltransferase
MSVGNGRARGAGSFFGRRKGRPLRAGQTEAVGDLAPALLIDLDKPAPADLTALFTTPVTSVRLEIGFGGGEHLLHRAAESPETGFIGVEPFENGMAKLLAALAREPRGNIRTFDRDAALLLDWLPETSLSQVDLLYPDPWPKKRHWKRRFVGPANLDRLARVLKPGGLFRFASDIDHYVNWTLLHARGRDAFEWLADGPDDWRLPYAGWQGTRYEAKALREGRVPAYLTFRRL